MNKIELVKCEILALIYHVEYASIDDEIENTITQ